MFRKLFVVLLLVLWLAIGAGLAQDPTKVEPTHYRLGFENERVQVVYIHYGPHEKSVMHDHPQGTPAEIDDATKQILLTFLRAER